MKTIKQFRKKKMEEDAPANSVGGGNIAGAGVGPQGEPGVLTTQQKKYRNANSGAADARTGAIMGFVRRATPQLEEAFAGHPTFTVSSEQFNAMRLSKKPHKHWRKYLGEGDHLPLIREYARKNPGKPIILQDEKTGAMIYARTGKL